LLDNANKYSPNKPEIKITSYNENNNLIISVKDKGIGMSKEVQSRIFEKFYRQTSGNIHNIKGHGLGLSYVKAITETFGGSIEIESEQGKGSEFILTLPLLA